MDNSPLSKLPPAVRTHIYELALQSATSEVKIRKARYTAKLTSPTAKRLLSLTRACKAIRAETNLMFFTINNFVMQAGNITHAFILLRAFAARIGEEKLQTLGSVEVQARAEYDALSDGYDQTTNALRELHAWSLSHPKLKLEVEEVYIEYDTPYDSYDYEIPLDLEHFTAQDGKPAYLWRYRIAYAEGFRSGRWGGFEALTGLEAPECA